MTVVVAGRQDVLGQFSMVSMELFNIVEDFKKVSKVFMVYPRNVNCPEHRKYAVLKFPF